MTDTDKDIIAVLLKSVFEKSLISEATYRNALDQIRIIDELPFGS